MAAMAASELLAQEKGSCVLQLSVLWISTCANLVRGECTMNWAVGVEQPVGTLNRETPQGNVVLWLVLEGQGVVAGMGVVVVRS